MSDPAAGANTRRKNANTLTTTLEANAPTPKLCASEGNTGLIKPNPMAITKAAATRTQTSPGIRGVPFAGAGAVSLSTISQYAVDLSRDHHSPQDRGWADHHIQALP